ncbi:hypothetical protein A0H81_10567 [Grifola frondosa]|uniref:Uncharacterized protein n=1 Tax=Grifola frondosa TaxID=5627 RepID=A0A1C7LY77_GRIFR|nr:hypothetical protein A0H81_10567 [Grifola frondosa]
MRPKSTVEASSADSRRGAKLPGISLPPSSYNFPLQPSVRPPDRSRMMGAGLRDPRQGLSVTMHSSGSILLEAHAIQNEESWRLSEMAFLT